jgi:multidrug efflux system membrane fusion protein
MINRENRDTLDGQDVQEHAPSFSALESPPSASPKQHGWWWVAILAALAVGAYVYYSRQHANSSPSAAADTAGAAGAKAGRGMAVNVVATRARKGDIGVYLTGLGAVTPVYTVTIKSQLSGYLMQVLYREGQLVHKGDALAEIDPRPYQVLLEQAQAALARDEATLANAKLDLQRYQTLVPLHAIPEQQLATQEALVKSTEATLKTDQAQIDAAKLDLVYCHITAPITGRVGLRLVDPGNYVTPGDSTGLVVITQVQPITVIFTVAEDQLPPVEARLHAGARLSVEAFDRDMKIKIADGYLVTIDNQIDPTTGTVKLRANFDNRDGSLFPNQFVNARLLVEEKHGVTLVPTAAVQRNGSKTYVYMVVPNPKAPKSADPNAPKHEIATVRQITIGTTEGDDVEVTSGLAPGDTVVMTGVDRLNEGTPVHTQIAGEGRSPKGSS